MVYDIEYGIIVCSYCEPYVMSAGLEAHYSTE